MRVGPGRHLLLHDYDPIQPKLCSSFAATHLVGFGAGGSGAVAVSLVDTDNINTNGTSFTHAIALGAAVGDRKIVVGISGTGTTAAARNITSVKLHVPDVATDPTGVTLTQVGEADNASEEWYTTEMWETPSTIASGTAGELVVTWDATMGDDLVSVYRLTGAGATYHAVQTDNDGDPLSVSINCPANGAVIGVAAEGGGGTWTWTGITEDGTEFSGDTTSPQSQASQAFATEQTGLTVEANQSVNSRPRMVVASWGPA